MKLKQALNKYRIHVFVGICLVFMLACLFFYTDFLYSIKSFWDLILDKEKLKAFICSCGTGAPLIFILIQILQVVFAPVPGEATGFIGGYIFGTFKGFLYSSIGLATGSWINFFIGRFFGEKYVSRLIPASKLEKFNNIIKHQGIILIFLLFVFPGFPKDYFCIFLGLSSIPVKVFIILASIGRMPGTFILSLHGASLFEESYGLFFIIFGLCLIFALLAYRYRVKVYQWVDRLNGKK